MDAVKTGALIRKCRTEKNYTQKQLAEMINVSAYAVSKWENGRGMPDISLLESLARALDISIGELVTGEEKAMTQNKDESLQQLIDAAKKQERRKTVITMIVTALAVCILGFASWYARKLYLSTLKIPVRFAETAEPGENGTILQRNIWIETQYNETSIQYFGPYASYKMLYSYTNEDGEGELLFFMRSDQGSIKNKELHNILIESNGESQLTANSIPLSKVWYYNGNDTHITEAVYDGSVPEQEEQNSDYVMGHWDELTADSILLYDYERPEQTKRQFSYSGN